MNFSEKDAHKITECIEAIEKKSAAEIVVVVRPRSGSYRDVNVLVAAGVAFVVLLVNLFSSWVVAHWFVPIDILLAFCLAYWLSRVTCMHRFFVPRARKVRQVRERVAVEFVHNKIYVTKQRIGLLVYVSKEEKKIEVLADQGILAHLPPDTWSWWVAGLDEVWRKTSLAEGLVAHLDLLGERLERYLPVTADDTDELPNAVVLK